MRGDIRQLDGPAGVGQPGLLLEVRCPERQTKAAPVIGGTAEEAQPGGIEKIWQADIVTFVEGLGGSVEVEIATLQKAEADGVINELPHEGNAGCASPDHTDVGIDEFAVRDRASVDEHGPLSSRKDVGYPYRTSWISAIRRIRA